MTEQIRLDRPQRILVGVITGGAVVIAGIGFAGSYTAVQHLAAAKGFGAFADWFPIGIDAGIVVLLALDLLLTWFRMPYPALRPAAWLLTAATIAFNGAAAWPDPLGVGMHAVIPVLFVVAVEAARHAIGRFADITADRHVEPVPLRRWLLAPWPTFRLWRRMHLWQIRTLDEAIALEQDRLEYRDRLRAKYGRKWRRAATVDERLPLRLARHGRRLDLAALAATPRPAVEPARATAPRATVAAPRHDAAERRATQDATTGATPRATDDATVDAPQRPDATPATKAPSKPKAKGGKGADRAAARKIIRAMYDDFGKRPEEPDMVAALKAADHPYTSRQYANKCRAEIERDEPKLLELGGSNVRALAG